MTALNRRLPRDQALGPANGSVSIDAHNAAEGAGPDSVDQLDPIKE